MRVVPHEIRIAVLASVFLWASAGATTAQEPKSSTAGPGGGRPNTLPAGVQVAALDFARLTAASSVAKTAFARVETATRTKSSELSERAKSLEAQRLKLEGEMTLLSESARTLAQQAFARAQLEFDRQREDAEAEVNNLRLEVERELRARLFPVVDAVAREKGLHLVLNVSSADFLWIDPDIDISEEVARRLDLAQKKPQ